MLAHLVDREGRAQDAFQPYERKPEVENDLNEVMKILTGGK